MSAAEWIEGAGGGGKGGGGSQRTPQEAPNTLRSTSKARIIDALGEGEIVGLVNGLQSVYLDDTPLQDENGAFNFQGVTVHTRTGEPDQPHIPGFPAVETANDVSTEVTQGAPIVRTVGNLDADAVRVTVQLPALNEQNTSNGDLVGASVEVAIDVRPMGGTWAERKRDTIAGKTTSPYQRTYRIELTGSGPWDVRVRRITPDSDAATLNNATYWATYTEVIDAKLSYPDTALVALEVDAQQFGNQIPARSYDVKGLIIRVPDNYDPETRSYTGFWGGNFKLAWSDNPAWCYYDLATKTRYGAALANVDKWALYQIAQYCDELVPDGFGGEEPRFTFNTVLASQEEAITALHTLASAFRGMTYWGTNTVMPVADMPADPVKLVTPANVIDGEFVYEGTGLKARHSVAMVSYNDPNDNYRQQVEVVEDAEAIELYGWRPLEINAVACTSRGQAHRLGKWTLASERAETETVSYRASLDHADVRPGDIISVSDPTTAGARLGGRIVATGIDALTLDKAPEQASGANWFLDVMLPSGAVERRAVASFNGDAVALANPLSAPPILGAVWILSSQAVEPRRFRVLANIEEAARVYHITALEHDPTKYGRIELGLDLPESDYSLLPTGPVVAPYSITAQAYTYLAGGTEHQGMTISWTPSDDPRVLRYIVEVQGPSDLRWRTVYTESGTSVDLRDVEPGQWMIRVRGVTGIGTASPWATLTTNIAGLLLPVPPDSVEVTVGTLYVTLRPTGLYPSQQFEFWRSNVALNTGEILSNAVHIGTGSSITDSERRPLTTYYYYIRGVNAYGESDWYPVQATTEGSPSVYLETISGEIKKSDLWYELEQEIDRIGPIGTEVDGITADVGALQGRADTISDSLAQTQQELEAEIGRINLIGTDVDGISVNVGSLTSRADVIESDLAQTQRALTNEAARIDGRVDGVQNTLTNEAARLDGEIGSVSNSLDAARTALEQTDAALSDRLYAADSAIVEERNERETELGFVANRLDGLVSNVGDNRASIGRLQRVQQEGDELDAIIYKALHVESASRQASIRTEEQVRIEGDSALAMRADLIEADIGDTNARITTVDQSRIDGDSALSSQIGELSAKVNALPQFGSGFEAGADFDQWIVAGTDTLTAEAGDIYAGLQSALLSSTASNPGSGGTTGATHAAIPAGATDAFEGFEVTIRVAAKQPSSNASAEFAVAYSTNTAGNSGWQKFTPTTTWQVFEFTYAVPEGSSGTTDYIGIWADTSGAGNGILIDSVSVKRVAGEILEITAAIEQANQARADGDAALTQQLNALTTSVGNNTSSIQQEAQTRASETQTLTQTTNTLRADVDDNAAGITTVEQAVADTESALSSRIDGVTSRTEQNEAAINSERTARTNADEALGVRIDSVEAEAGDNAAAIQAETTSRADADTALGQRIDTVEATAGDNAAAIQSESTARADADTALGQRVDVVKAEVGDNTAGLAEEAKVRASETGANAARISSLSLSRDQQAASIQALQRLRSEGDELEAIQFEAISVESASRQASVRTEEQARIEDGVAFASRASAIEASVDDVDARVTSEASARADGDSALGERIDTVQAGVDGVSSAIQSESSARADADSALGSRIDTVVASASSANSAAAQAQADADAAAQAAADAAGIANSKGKVLIRSSAPAATDRLPQNLWIDTSGGGNTPKRWNGSAWKEVTDKVAKDAATAAAAAQQKADEADGKADQNAAAIQSESTARADEDSALGQRIDTVQAAAGDNAAGLAEEVLVRASETGANAARISSLSLNSSQQKAAIQALQRLRQEGDEIDAIQFEAISVESASRAASVRTEEKARVDDGVAFASRMSSIEASVDDVDARVTSEATARSDADTALGSRIDSVEGSVADNTAAIQSESTARANADEALGQRIDTVVVDVAGNQSAIQSEITARANADTALGSRIDTVQATAGDNATAIQSEITARADADTALGNQINTVQSQLGDDIASVQQQTQTNIDEQKDRINAMWTLRTDVNGLVGGMGLANDGQQVDMAFRADLLSIAPPGLPQNAVVPFIVKGSTTYLKEAMIESLTFSKMTDDSGTFVVQNGKLKAKYVQADQLVVSQGQSTNYLPGARGWKLTPTGGEINFPIQFNSIQGAGALASKNNVNYNSDVTNKPTIDIRRLNTNAYDGGQLPDTYPNDHKVGQLIFELSNASGWPETFGGVVTYWYAGNRATQICYGNDNDREFVRYTRPNIYPQWTPWKQKEIFSSSDVNALQAINGPAQAGADVTGSNTAADTAKVAGTNAATVRDRANAGNNANNRVNAWVRPDSTLIDGNKIFTGDAYVDTLQIKGNAITIPSASFTGAGISLGTNWTTVQTLWVSRGNAPVHLTFGCSCSADEASSSVADASVSARLLIDGYEAAVYSTIVSDSARSFNTQTVTARARGLFSGGFLLGAFTGSSKVEIQLSRTGTSGGAFNRFIQALTVKR